MKMTSLLSLYKNSGHSELPNNNINCVENDYKKLGFGFRGDGSDRGEMPGLILVLTVTYCVSLPLLEPLCSLQ